MCSKADETLVIPFFYSHLRCHKSIIVSCEDCEFAVPLVTAFMDFALAAFAVLPNSFELSAQYYRDQ